MNKRIAEIRRELIDEREAGHKDIPLNYVYVRGERWLWTPDYDSDLNAAWVLFCELPQGYTLVKYGLQLPNGEIIANDPAYAICEAWLQLRDALK